MASTKEFCIHSDGYGRCDILSDGQTCEYCVEGPCPHEKVVKYEPVQYGRWIKSGNEKKCSVCGFVYYSNADEWNGCPNCLARKNGGIE